MLIGREGIQKDKCLVIFFANPLKGNVNAGYPIGWTKYFEICKYFLKKMNLNQWSYNNPLKAEHFMVILDMLWQENVLLFQYTLLTAINLMTLVFSHSC